MVRHDAVSFRKAFDARADLDDLARQLVPEDRSRLAANVPGEQVGPADPARAGLHERFSRTDSRNRNLHHRHGRVRPDPHRLHGNTA